MSRFSKVTPRLPVVNLSRTIGFYLSLGFQIDLLLPEESPAFAILEMGAVGVQFYVPEEGAPEVAGHATLNFETKDVSGLHLALKQKMQIEWGPEVYPYGRREFAIRDPEGYLLIFTEPTDDPPTCSES